MKKWSNILLVLSAIYSHPAAAEQPLFLEPLNVETRYRFHWNMVGFGTLDMSVAQHDNTRMKSAIQTTGVVRIFSKHESTSTLTASNPSPSKGARTYETFYKTKDKPRHVKMTYDTGGAVTQLVVEPPEPKEKRPAVAPELQYGSIDPLTLVMELRERTFEALASGAGSYTTRLFDGRRLMDLEVTVIGRQKLTAENNTRDVVKVTITRTPVTGFTSKEMSKITNGEPPLEVYFSDDAYFLPVRLQADVMLGTLAADLVGLCNAPCKL